MRIGIVGGGIAGLSTALTLLADGHDVTCFERHTALADGGSGLVLARNAQSVLEVLGLSLDHIGAAFDVMETRDASGRVLQRVVTTGSDGTRPVCVPRTDLHRLLMSHLPPGVVHTQDVTDVRREGAYATIEAGEGHTFDLVVGADGLNSRVRASLGLGRLRYSGQTCWRWIGPAPRELVGPDSAREFWTPGCRLGLVPLGEGRYYMYLVVDAPRGDPAPATLTGLRHLFDGCPPAQTVIDTLHDVPDLHHDLVELDRPVWGRGRIALIGDAAHAMTPNLGQGAAMAIEDGAGLALALRAKPTDPVPELARRRQSRVRRIQMLSRRIGAVSHWRTPAAAAARNRALRWMPDRVGRSQYRSVLQPGVELAASFGA